MATERPISDIGDRNCMANWLIRARIDESLLVQWIKNGFPTEIGLTPRNINAIKLQFENPEFTLKELVSIPDGGRKVTANLKKSAYRIKNYINSHDKLK